MPSSTMPELSTKPYLIRAIYEWCADSSFTPYLNVKVDQHTRVPLEYVKNGEIVLSMSQQATRNLTIGNELIQFSARFNGVSREITVPIYAVQSVFARENGRGVFFQPEAVPERAIIQTQAPAVTPNLQSVSLTSAPPPLSQVQNSLAEPDPETPSPDKPKAPPRGKLRIIK
ncbi:MAG: ClpXP protease specificity-enhancing factor [Burkholderiales bacterium]|nr:ClpXP protease specificity-enhancing factor [Burkholderiales bacterium]